MSDSPASRSRTAALRRRDVVRFGIAGALGWPGSASAQERVRTIGMVSGLPMNDRLMGTQSNNEASRIPLFKAGLQRLGWVEGRNIKYEIRSTYGGPAART